MTDNPATVPIRTVDDLLDHDCILGHDYDLSVIDLGPVTRVVILTELGGKYQFWADSWEFSMQDGSRTLKLFGRGEGHQARTRREMELAAQMREDQLKMHDRMHGLTEGQEPE